ncbi:hypothetical protein P3S68_006513 [Capsicum galapagoense]
MSHGHTIPLLHLATLLCRRFIAVTVFTTPATTPPSFAIFYKTHPSPLLNSLFLKVYLASLSELKILGSFRPCPLLLCSIRQRA